MKKLYNGKWIKIFERDGWEFASRKNRPVFSPSVVCVIARDKHRKLLVVSQVRRSIDLPVWEFPAGIIDEGESFEEAAIRETKEETGMDLTPESFVSNTLPSAGMSDENVVMVYGTVTGKLDMNCREGDISITPYLLSLDQQLSMITGGGTQDSKLTAYLMGKFA